MNVVEVQDKFGIKNINIAERPMPKPGHNEVLVRMNATSLNFRDLLMVKGQYDPRQSLPLIPCSDGAGVVIEVGANTSEIKEGDLVTTLFSQWLAGKPTFKEMRQTLGGPLDGTLTEYMVLKENSVLPYPKHLTPVEAATLPCAALTAWNALVVEGKIKAGDKVLIQGTGGVAIFALQFAKIFGAETIVLSSSDEKLEKVQEMGANHTINYKKNPKWGKKVLQVTKNEGVDIVVELGGAGTLEQSFYACRPGARIAFIGVLAGISKEINLISIIMKKLHISGILVGTRESFLEMNKAIEQHNLHPVINKIFPMKETQKAMNYMEEASHFGKICIEI